MYQTENNSRNNNQIILLISTDINTRRIRVQAMKAVAWEVAQTSRKLCNKELLLFV